MSKTDDTKRRILQAAADTLARGENPSMARIAEVAGVTRQLLYLHYDGRAALLLEVARMLDATARTADRQARVDDAPDAVTALREAVALQGHIKPLIDPVASAIDRLRAVDAAAAAAWDEREAARHGRCVALVERMAREGVLAEEWRVEVAARLLWSVTSQHAWADLVKDGGWSTRRWVRHTTHLLERAFVGTAS